MNILLVDDEQIALEAMKDILSEVAPEAVVYAYDEVQAAMQCVETQAIEVAFLDIEMQEINGLQFAKMIKEINPKINIIFVTGYSAYALDALNLYASGYLLKPTNPGKVKEALEHLREPVAVKRSDRLVVQCFGNFEVFYDGKPVSFPRQKSKELFAYLIDRRGAQASMPEIAAILWEDGQYNLSRNNQIHSFLHDLIKTLEQYGSGDIILHQRNAIAVDISKVDCDCYDCLKGNPAAINAYTGEYMSQYSWAEFMTGQLSGILL